MKYHALVACIVLAGATVAADAQPAAPAARHRMSFFISSTAAAGTGNLGGLAGADKICQDAATSVGAGDRTWRAYLSQQATGNDPSVDARTRIGAGPWYNAKGSLIASNVADLHGDILRDRNTIADANALNEKGEKYMPADMTNMHDIMTGSDPEGRAYPAGLDTTCNNWTSEGNDHKSIMAHADRSGPNTSWNSTHLSRGCSKEALFMNGYSGHLYCFATTP